MLAKQRTNQLFRKSLRILIIHTRYAESGGECSVVQNEITLLKKNGCDIREMYFDNNRFTKVNVLLMMFNIFSFFKVLKACIKYRPALVHIHNTHFAASHSIIFAIKILRIPVIKTLHNYRLLCPTGVLYFNDKLYLKSLHKSFPWQAVKDRVYRNSTILTFWLAFSNWFHRKIGTWKLVNKYFVFSEQGKQLVLDSNLGIKSNQVVMKPNFAPINTMPTVNRNDSFLFVGRLSQEKGITVLLDAFARNGLPLTIIGDGLYSAAVKEAMQQNPLIVWKGYQHKEIINQELKKCTAVIFPSVCYEGMPLTIIEAFASGTPVITSRLGAMENMIQHNYNGLFFEPGDSNDLNRQLLKWTAIDEPLKSIFRKNAAKDYMQKYTPEKNAEILLAVYDAVLQRRYPFLKKMMKDKILPEQIKA